MGLFNNIKNLFKKKEDNSENKNIEEISKYEVGLSKSRDNFVSRLIKSSIN